MEGSGEPLLLLHKAGLSSDEYTEMLAFLGKKYKAIAMDVLGYGNTDLPKPEPKFDDYVKLHAAWVAEWDKTFGYRQ